MMIEKCKGCNRFNSEKGVMRNKLWCMLGCEEYQKYQSRKAFEYNKSVSGEEFDTRVLYEHGNEVYGSGWNG